MTNWKDIHPDFTPELQREWEDRGFSYEECKEWIESGLNIHCSDFCSWLKNKKKLTTGWFLVLDQEDRKNLWEDYFNRNEIKQDKNLDEEKCSNTQQEDIDAQEWLDKTYSEKERWKLQRIIINKSLLGRLDLSEFDSLIWIYISPEVSKTSFQIINQPEESAVVKCVYAQEWLDKEYPLEKRSEIKRLDVIGINVEITNLSGSLIIKDWVNLEEVKVKWNQLTSLKIVNCPRLKKVDANMNLLVDFSVSSCPSLSVVDIRDNKLTDLSLTNCSEIKDLQVSGNKLSHLNFLINLELEKLTHLDIGNNRFPAQDLTIFNQLISNNLERLKIDNNLFFGSCQPLSNYQNLKELLIVNTKLDSGLEYLPESLERIYCVGTSFEKELESYNDSYQAWKQAQLIKSLEEENAKIDSLEEEILTLTKLIKQQKEKIVKAYLHFAPEKELLKEVIVAYLEYVKTKKKGLPSVKFRKQFETLRNELESKVEEEFAEEIETILNDCESLVTLELELEAEITKRKLLLEDAYQKVLSITVNINEKIEAYQGNIYIANIFKAYTELDNQPEIPSITEMLENNSGESQKETTTTNTKTTNIETIMTDNNNPSSNQNEQPAFSITGGITTHYGHANIGNTYESTVDLSSRYYANPNDLLNKKQQLVEEIKEKINEEGKKILQQILTAVQEHVRNQTDWDDDELDESIQKLKNMSLESEKVLNSEIRKICKEQVKETEEEMRPQAQIQQANY